MLAFYQSITKHYYQYKFDKINGYCGLGYGFFAGEMGWVVSGLAYGVGGTGKFCGLEVLLVGTLGYLVWVRSRREKVVRFITGEDVRKRFF